MSNELHSLITKRWSPKAFDDRAIDDNILRAIMSAAQWAPSCYNDQPWRFIVTSRSSPAAYEKLLDCLVPGNRAWAQSAPVLILTIARLNFEHNETPNRHASYDLGMAVGNLLVQATHLGLSAHQMAGFDVDKARVEFNIPHYCDPMAVMALGYKGDAAQLPQGVIEADPSTRTRKPLTDIVFDGEWGEGYF